MQQSTYSFAPLVVACEHNGATSAVFSPIAWQYYNVPTATVRTAELSSSVARAVLLWLPPRTRTDTVGRVVVSSFGSGTSGTITLATYQVVREAHPNITQSTGHLDVVSYTGATQVLSNVVTDNHLVGGGDWLTETLTNIDLNASTDPLSDPVQFFSSLYLKVMVAYGTGGARGMYITGIGVENW